MYKIVFIASIFLVIYLVNGDHNPNAEVEQFGGTEKSINQLKNTIQKIAEETNKLRDLLESAKKNMADGVRSDSNINKLLAMPKEVANLTRQLQSTINELEKKELLA